MTGTRTLGMGRTMGTMAGSLARRAALVAALASGALTACGLPPAPPPTNPMRVSIRRVAPLAAAGTNALAGSEPIWSTIN